MRRLPPGGGRAERGDPGDGEARLDAATRESAQAAAVGAERTRLEEGQVQQDDGPRERHHRGAVTTAPTGGRRRRLADGGADAEVGPSLGPGVTYLIFGPSLRVKTRSATQRVGPSLRVEARSATQRVGPSLRVKTRSATQRVGPSLRVEARSATQRVDPSLRVKTRSRFACESSPY